MIKRLILGFIIETYFSFKVCIWDGDKVLLGHFIDKGFQILDIFIFLSIGFIYM